MLLISLGRKLTGKYRDKVSSVFAKQSNIIKQLVVFIHKKPLLSQPV